MSTYAGIHKERGDARFSKSLLLKGESGLVWCNWSFGTNHGTVRDNFARYLGHCFKELKVKRRL